MGNFIEPGFGTFLNGRADVIARIRATQQIEESAERHANPGSIGPYGESSPSTLLRPTGLLPIRNSES
ncbi:MAG: hypothetical protein ACXVKH_04055 [Candidatus Angelobacter sp.]